MVRTSRRGRRMYWNNDIILINMKTIWSLFSLVFGILFFFIGCVVDVLIVELFGAIVMFPGLIGLLEKLWPEEEVRG